MSTAYEDTSDKQALAQRSLWLDRLLIALTVLAWIVLICFTFWLMGKFARPLILLAIGAILAYALYPLVQGLKRFMPRWLAMTVVYLLALGALGLFFYFVGKTIVGQIVSLSGYVEGLVKSGGGQTIQAELDWLEQFGITRAQIADFGRQFASQLQGLARNILPLVTNVFNIVLNTILIALLSVYFMLIGPNITTWLRTKTPVPQRKQIALIVDITGKVIGGYIRGNILLAVVISTLTGIGLALIGVPYALVLALIAFVLEFIPVIGIYVTAAAIILVAITQGPVVTALAVGIMLLLQLLENDVFAPRILGGSVGLNPIITIFAVIAGSELFGVAGAFFAAPVAGLIQALMRTYWQQWRDSHPEKFPPEEKIVKYTAPLEEESATAATGDGK